MPAFKSLSLAALGGLSLFQADAVRMATKAHVAVEGTKVIHGVPVYNYAATLDGDRATSFLQQTKGETVAGREHFNVFMREGITDAELDAVCDAYPEHCVFHGHAAGVPFLQFEGAEEDLERMLREQGSRVEFAEPDLPTFVVPELPAETADADVAAAGEVSVQNANSWGLARIGVPVTPVAGRDGTGVSVYVMDTGIRYSHQDFGGRAQPAVEILGTTPWVCNGNRACAFDRQGHGTHCAGTVGGRIWGVAPGATIFSVKVLSDSGSGSLAWTAAGLDWIAVNGRRPTVASLSLGGGGTSASQRAAVDAAVNRGVTVVVAAGNSASNACNFQPAFVPSAITVGATTSTDAFASYSNWGTCVNILAPGSSIPSAGHLSDTQRAVLTGTSMACPHVAGVAALILQGSPGLSPAQVLQTLQGRALRNVILGNLNNAPNLLLQVR